ncbi:hypothetical protein ARMGADRAFT_1085939 [Armillaria gallica]|uniref:Uncharacterized protein n=1 Tax=Armillaria gallica TaxID=47427 RepID=A0A2H3CVX1_ARMGA|nr:hypothetical protein ARMGADRAFT_1085939 [Armillaria gallica]
MILHHDGKNAMLRTVLETDPAATASLCFQSVFEDYFGRIQISSFDILDGAWIYFMLSLCDFPVLAHSVINEDSVRFSAIASVSENFHAVRVVKASNIALDHVNGHIGSQAININVSNRTLGLRTITVWYGCTGAIVRVPYPYRQRVPSFLDHTGPIRVPENGQINSTASNLNHLVGNTALLPSLNVLNVLELSNLTFGSVADYFWLLASIPSITKSLAILGNTFRESQSICDAVGRGIELEHLEMKSAEDSSLFLRDDCPTSLKSLRVACDSRSPRMISKISSRGPPVWSTYVSTLKNEKTNQVPFLTFKPAGFELTPCQFLDLSLDLNHSP